MTFPRFKAVADTALLVELGDTASPELNNQVIALDQAINEAAINGLVELVPAMVNLLVIFDPLATDHDTVEQAIEGILPLDAIKKKAPKRHEITVCYDQELCPDLIEVAKATNLTVDEVICAHQNSVLTVAMYGFAPGYAYLSGLNPQIQIPRKPAALRDVPKGSVIIAGAQCLLTTLTMPTGWSIIGRTGAEIMTGDETRPFLFDVGDQVTFTRITRSELPKELQKP